jgi:hypothetical protein
LAGWLSHPRGPNIAVTIHNIVALVAGILHMTDMVSDMQGKSPEKDQRTRQRNVFYGYLDILIVVALLLWLL